MYDDTSSGYTALVDLVATQIKLSLSGLFGKSGRYYEFRDPLEMIVETEEHGSWVHRLAGLDIWTVEPARVDSLFALMDMLDAEFESYGNPALKFKHPAATNAHKRFHKVVKHVY